MQHLLQALPHHIRRNQLHQSAETDDHLRSEVSLFDDGDQSVNIDALNVDISFKEFGNEDCNAPDVFVVSLEEELLDITRYLLISELPKVIFGDPFTSHEEVEGKDTRQVFSWNFALDVLVELAETNFAWLAQPQDFQELHDLMEVFVSFIVEVSQGNNDLVFGVNLKDLFTVAPRNLIVDVFLNSLFPMASDPSSRQEEVMARCLLALLFAGLLFFFEDSVVDGLQDFFFGDVVD